MTNRNWRCLGVMVICIPISGFVKAAWAEDATQPNPRPASEVAWATQCKALASTDLSGIVDAPTQVMAAKLVDASADLPAYCQVSGYVTPNVGVDMRLPTTWNGKYMQMGCGGHCGMGLEGNNSSGCDNALRKGYACLASDMGHKGIGGDGLWGNNNLQAKLDWGYRATHVAALAGRAIAERFYAQGPKNSYFVGCSTGGRQALQEAQRFPWDFDGIIAGAPPVNLSTIYMTFAWGIRATHDSAGQALLGIDDLKLLTATAVAKCDLDDGVKDGVIGDPLHCAFDPSELACKSGQVRGCLTFDQIEAVKKVYAGPMSSSGVKLSLGGPVPGSEYAVWMGYPNDWRAAYVGVDGKPSGYELLATEGFRYLFFLPEPGPTWKMSDFDFDQDYKRLGLMQFLYDSSNPDLRQFKAAGGKMISYQGMNDNSVLPRSTIDYYETVERTMGGREATQDFFRLYVLPGVQHCTGGDGAFAVDYLSYLEAWVEKGQAPEKLMSAHVRLEGLRWDNPADSLEAKRRQEFPLDPATIEFSRPVYPYPIRAKYSGRGDSKDAANFIPTRH